MKKLIGTCILVVLFIGGCIALLEFVPLKALLISLGITITVYGLVIYALYLIFDET